MISILLPTRKRSIAVIKSIESLEKNAKDFNNIEILLRYDDDDNDRIEYPNTKIFSGVRHGYEQLHKYYNELADRATGEWVFIWNDDFFMQTKNYDEIIMSIAGFKVLNVHCENHYVPTKGREYSIAPIVPKKWYELLGHLSLNAHNDSWIDYIGDNLGILTDVPITIHHDRADITGNNDDETYSDRKYQEGDFWEKTPFRNQDEAILRDYITSI